MKPSLVLAFALLALAGCERAPKPTCPAGKLCMHIGNQADPTSLDPQVITTFQADAVVADLFVGLLTEDANAKPIPGVAESWTTSRDGLVWTFKLRDSTWSDGVPLTAEDFVYSFRRLQSPETAAQPSYLSYVLRNAEAINTGKAKPETLGVRAIDAHTLELTLEHPAPYLPSLLVHTSLYAVPRHVISRWGDAWIKPPHVVSNGPFTLDYAKLGDRTRLLKNPRFYDAKNVCLDEVYLYPTADSISAERRVRAGQLDVNTDIQSNRIAYVRGQIPDYVRTYPWLGTVYLAFNQKLPKFKDARVRQALSMAMDREFITAKLLRGSQPPAYGFVTPGVQGYGDGVKAAWAGWPLSKRQDEAKRLLAAAGYGPGNPLKTAIKIRNISDPMLIMPAIQADWRAIGVEVALEPEESQIAYADFRARNFEIADASWIADFDDPLTYLALLQTKTGVQNYGDYSNPAYDALLERSEREPDPGKRMAVLKQAERMMVEDAGVAPIYFYISKNLVNPAVTGWLENVPDHHRRRWVCFKDAAARRAANKGTG